jgi:hypothetical protein
MTAGGQGVSVGYKPLQFGLFEKHAINMGFLPLSCLLRQSFTAITR